MPKRSKGWKTYERGKALWIWWADGRGGKVRKRLVDESGRPLDVDASPREINRAAACTYEKCCRLAHGEVSGEEAAAELTLGQLQREFAESHSDGWSGRSCYDISLYMRTLERFFSPSQNPNTITAKAADQYRQWLLREGGDKGRPISLVTARNRFLHAVRLFDWAVNLEQVRSNPFRKVKPIAAKPIGKKEPFTLEEVARILAVCREKYHWFYPVILTAAVTGSRRGPLPCMEVRDFDKRHGTLVARDKISKKQKGHFYHLPEPVARELARISAGRDDHDPLFVDDEGKPINEKMFDKPNNCEKPSHRRVWFRLLRDARVTYRGIHNLRRGAVSNLVAANVSMDRVTAVTGQTVEVARDHYLQLDGRTQRATMEKLLELYGLEGDGTCIRRVTLDLDPEEARLLAELLGKEAVDETGADALRRVLAQILAQTRNTR